MGAGNDCNRDSAYPVGFVGSARIAAGERAPRYERHQPEKTLLYQIIDEYYPRFLAHMERQGRYLPQYVQQEFDDYLECGLLERGFLRVRCEDCHHERLVAFSCKRRGIRPSCGARRMAESAALLVDDVLPHQPIRQWVLSFPFPLRFLLASYPEFIGKVLGIVQRVLSTHLIKKAGFNRNAAQPNSKFRARVTPAERGRGRRPRQPTGENWLDKTSAERHVAMTWMQRLKRVFNIDIETCERCAGQVKIIVEASNRCIEERVSHHRSYRENPRPPERQSIFYRAGDATKRPCATATGSSFRLNPGILSYLLLRILRRGGLSIGLRPGIGLKAMKSLGVGD